MPPMPSTNAGCTAFTYSRGCNVVVTVGAAFAGEYIQPAFQQQCLEAYNSIETNCGLDMGSAAITTTADNQEYNIDMYATTEDTSGECANNGTTDFFAATCGTDQCLPSTN
jgi:hypothetical protein